MTSKKNRAFTSPSKSSGNSLLPWMGIAFIVILLDQISKITILRSFELYEIKPVTSFFNLAYHINKGASWGLLDTASGWQKYLFIAIGIVASIVMIYLIKQSANQRRFCWALSLIMGGALGNVIDRIWHGHVIDFLSVHYQDVYTFPTFNLADSAICLGAFLFILDELRRVKK